MGVRFGRYELLRPLSRGGMAEVFLARYVGPEGFEKRLVIKRVLPQLVEDHRFLRLFFEEARTQVSLSHGNLVPVFDFGRVGNDYFIAMEHVPGCDFGTLLSAARQREARLVPALVAHVGIEVGRGLAYVHRRGFVHRDVSPRNVLLSTDGEVKLSDFGVALAAESDAAPGVRGTLAYMAPEQARGERPDGRADQFALGMVLAEALVGRRLRQHAGDDAALAAARAGDSVAVEGPLGPVLARATRAAREERFADMEAMLLALEQAAAELGRVGAAAARELAQRIAEWAPPRDDGAAEPAEPPPRTAATEPGAGAPETYYRDQRSDRFVDEVLAPATPGSARRGRWIAVAVVAAALLAVGVAARAVQSSRAHRPTAAATSTAAASRPLSGAPAASATPPTEKRVAAASPTTLTPPTANPVAPTPPPARTAPARALATTSAHAPVTTSSPSAAESRHARRPAGAGTLIVNCTPWCIAAVDDRVHGQDGRRHTLALPAGPHRVSVRRLDDHQERTIDLRPGEARTLDFTFE